MCSFGTTASCWLEGRYNGAVKRPNCKKLALSKRLYRAGKKHQCWVRNRFCWRVSLLWCLRCQLLSFFHTFKMSSPAAPRPRRDVKGRESFLQGQLAKLPKKKTPLRRDGELKARKIHCFWWLRRDQTILHLEGWKKDFL